MVPSVSPFCSMRRNTIRSPASSRASSGCGVCGDGSMGGEESCDGADLGGQSCFSLGLGNGDLFGLLAAFSPGYLALQSVVGAPRIFVAHGTQDTVLPIDTCGRPIVRQLQDWGYDVRFRTFEGPHTIPSDVAREAMAWMVG